MDAGLVVMDRLREHGVDARARKDAGEGGPATGPAEIDVWLPRRSVPLADGILAECGFHRVVAPGHGDHRFWVTFAERRWTKLDARLDPPRRDRPTRDRLLRQLPILPRRTGPVVAFLGPDGAGKSTVVHGLATSLPIASSVVYLGARGRRPPTAEAAPAAAVAAARRTGPRAALREAVFVVYRTVRRQVPALLRAYRDAWRGRVVLCDRHPLDALAVDGRHTALGRRVERLVAGRLVPRPDVVVVLDVPAEEMYARKGEHDVERLRRWRTAYREELVPRGAHVVPAGGSLEDVVADAGELVWGALARRRGWPVTGGPAR